MEIIIVFTLSHPDLTSKLRLILSFRNEEPGPGQPRSENPSARMSEKLFPDKSGGYFTDRRREQEETMEVQDDSPTVTAVSRNATKRAPKRANNLQAKDVRFLRGWGSWTGECLVKLCR